MSTYASIFTGSPSVFCFFCFSLCTVNFDKTVLPLLVYISNFNLERERGRLNIFMAFNFENARGTLAS